MEMGKENMPHMHHSSSFAHPTGEHLRGLNHPLRDSCDGAGPFKVSKGEPQIQTATAASVAAAQAALLHPSFQASDQSINKLVNIVKQ